MPELTNHGQQIVLDLSQRHGFSTDAVQHMLVAVVHGNGGMAQFSHPEFAGSGQWMQGGMIMIGDMFNNYLKGRIESLCSEIANIVNQGRLIQTGSFQSQSQSGGADSQHQTGGGFQGPSTLFVPDPNQHWWPKDLHQPSATGGQNQVQYAYFAPSRRLAVKTGQSVWVYDTLNHQIGGFSQQQGGGDSIVFTSQFGTVQLSSLPVVSRNGEPTAQPTHNTAASVATNHANPASIAVDASSTANEVRDQSESMTTEATTGQIDIFSSIEKLADLLAKGILTQEEFAAKKTELLARL